MFVLLEAKERAGVDGAGHNSGKASSSPGRSKELGNSYGEIVGKWSENMGIFFEFWMVNWGYIFWDCLSGDHGFRIQGSWEIQFCSASEG